MASLTGKVFSIIGASQGIGLGVAEVLASRGASILLGSRSPGKLEAAAKSVKARYPEAKVETHAVDACDRASIRDFLQQANTQFGVLHGCVNVAGILGANMNVQNIWEMDTEEYDYVMQGNATAIFNCVAEQLRPDILAASDDPHVTTSIVNVSSIAALSTFPRSAPYNASKIAVLGLTKTAALEAGPRNIRVNCIAP
ncbi:3-oxoacyl-[acyl-carrier- ] reductase [Pyrenophora seminiperda CCB06]|uniref:3-oxoacyl-[acyl-carrier-] reductase n=1 Tax=Pyrenophora seminiperda CCB06 TaxID=1302712 RepID=A0A3M7M1I0_9PLEO|nr:3-oxoacyl-[acyl-carrier- ] reductase [Pyrenophora seminiperda CCB06]